jgi:NAD(P)H-dependent flavin oxidoreductase YrpB (nitropropane dioxygenase family)
MLQVGTTEEARAARAANVDVIVAQGMEAGGHVRGQVGLLPLLPTIVEAVAPTPVLGAGGIVSGRGLAAALSLGAEGVLVGTRFVASQECEAHADYKQRLIDAEESDTVYCDVYHLGWPPHSPHRALRNALTEGGTPPSGAIARVHRDGEMVDVPPFASMTPSIHVSGRTELMANYAGQGVGLVRNVLPAAEIVDRMMAEAEETIRGLSTMIGGGRGPNAV